MTEESIAIDQQVSSLGTSYEPYIVYKSIILEKFASQFKIQRKDRKSLRIQKNLGVHYAKAFEYIENVRDEFLQLAFKNLEYEQAKQELKTFLELMNPVETVWADIIKRCTKENPTHEHIMPFNYDFDAYKGTYVTRTRNEMIKLRIPGRIRAEYFRELEQAYILMTKSFRFLKNKFAK